jgi:hypothetical protein
MLADEAPPMYRVLLTLKLANFPFALVSPSPIYLSN